MCPLRSGAFQEIFYYYLKNILDDNGFVPRKAR
jgi:hypothetical protein